MELAGSIYTIELRESGVCVKERNRHKKASDTIPLSVIACLGGRECETPDGKFRVLITEKGITVKRSTDQARSKEIDWVTICNLSRSEPVLFPEFEPEIVGKAPEVTMPALNEFER